MFIQARSLLVIDSSHLNADLVYRDLKSLDIINAVYGDIPKEDILKSISSLPQQTIFCKKTKKNESDDDVFYIAIPFFSSHIKTPVKSGEFIWIYQYENDATSSLRVSSYWLSRVHGLSYSEDVNYTFGIRDRNPLSKLRNYSEEKLQTREVKSLKKKDLKDHHSAIGTSMKKPESFESESNFDLSNAEIAFVENTAKSMPLRAISRLKNSADDLTFQGSNNTLVKLTSSNYSLGEYSKNNIAGGEVILAAGIGKYTNILNPNVVIGNFISEDGEILNERFSLLHDTSSNSSVKLSYDGFEENLKLPSMYTMFTPPEPGSQEGASNVFEDASKIIISESSDFSSKFGNASYNRNRNILTYSQTTAIKDFDNILFDKEKKYTTEFYVPLIGNNPFKSKNTPTISLVSNDVNIYSRKDGDNVTLTKEYELSESGETFNSFIRMSNNGDIFIDANRIFIGSSSTQSINTKFENGKGTVVRIGESAFSEPLVLGQRLKFYLQEMLDVHRQDMDDTKSLFAATSKSIDEINKSFASEFRNKINNYINSTGGQVAAKVAPLASAPPPAVGALASKAISDVYVDILSLCADLVSAVSAHEAKCSNIAKSLNNNITSKKMKKDEELSLRLKAIEDNIDKILSKVSKTS
jgi:hypothetical protein